MTQDSACLLRAIKGPVVMITIGVLFALDGFTQFSFNRTWPILLVVLGIMSLGRRPSPLRGRMRYQAQWGPPRPPVPPPPPPSPASAWAPSAAATAPPGSYRGSSYATTPGTSAPRGDNKENRERGTNPPGKGVTQ